LEQPVITPVHVDEDDENDEIIAALRALAAPVVMGSTASSQSPPRSESFTAPQQQQQEQQQQDNANASTSTSTAAAVSANPNPKKRSVPQGSATQLRGRRPAGERERDFKSGAKRRAHHVDSAILSAPTNWTDTECSTMLVQVLQRADQRTALIRELAPAPRKNVEAVRQAVLDVENDLSILSRVCCTSVLPLASLLCYFRSRWTLSRQSQQVRALSTACESGTIAYELVYTNALPPPPSIPFKGKAGQAPHFYFNLFIANGTSGDVPPLPVSTSVVATSKCIAKEFCNTTTPLANELVRIHADGNGSMADLIILESSRMEFVTLSFKLVNAPNLPNQPPPLASPPMIVVTNESQWPGAAKRLLWHDTFVDEQEIPWPLFANMLNMHMICGLQQSLDNAVRPLYDWEMRYLHGSERWFAGERMITREAALSFWNFFGAALTILRFKRHIFTMWSRGEVVGFMSRDNAAQLLAGRPVGAFCIRFSESLPGAFAVAFISGKREQPGEAGAVSRVQVAGEEPTIVRHFLILPTQLGHNRTLPDFLRDKPEFLFLVGLRSVENDKDVKVHAKDEVLSQYYKHDRLEGKEFPGYINVATDS
jgi:hypothetical protein